MLKPIGEKLAHLRRISCHSDRGDETFGDNESASCFQLPGRKPIAHNRIEREIERFQSIEKFLIDRLEQREIRFVIDNRDVGGSLLAGLGAFQLHVILIRDQIGRHENTRPRQNCAESAFRERRSLLPWTKIIIGLPGHVYPNECQFRLDHGLRDRNRFGHRRRLLRVARHD